MNLGDIKKGATGNSPATGSIEELFKIIGSKSKTHALGIMRFGKWVADQWNKGNKNLDPEIVRKQIRSCFGPIDEKIDFTQPAHIVLEQILQALDFDEEITRNIINSLAMIIPSEE